MQCLVSAPSIGLNLVGWQNLDLQIFVAFAIYFTLLVLVSLLAALRVRSDLVDLRRLLPRCQAKVHDLRVEDLGGVVGSALIFPMVRGCGGGRLFDE